VKITTEALQENHTAGQMVMENIVDMVDLYMDLDMAIVDPTEDTIKQVAMETTTKIMKVTTVCRMEGHIRDMEEEDMDQEDMDREDMDRVARLGIPGES
jgi:hypothetical protein